MTKNNFLILVLILLMTWPLASLAGRAGVGVNVGRIKVEETLKPGGIYQLPSVGVINTGEEKGEYHFSVVFLENQKALRPSPEWFKFSPPSFPLTGGQLKTVGISLTLPVSTRPGEYFAYLEAQPFFEKQPGTTFGIAASTELYFKVAPANLWQGLFWRLSFWLEQLSPWGYVVLLVVALALLVSLFKRFFQLQINIKKK